MAKRTTEQPSLFGGDVGSGVEEAPDPHVRATDPVTSHAAARAAVIGFNRNLYQTLWLYSGFGEIDEDAWKRSAELEEGQWKEGTVAKRRHRAMEKGLIEQHVDRLTGNVITRVTDHGQPAIVWRLTEKGREIYARWLRESGDPRAAGG